MDLNFFGPRHFDARLYLNKPQGLIRHRQLSTVVAAYLLIIRRDHIKNDYNPCFCQNVLYRPKMPSILRYYTLILQIADAVTLIRYGRS